MNTPPPTPQYRLLTPGVDTWTEGDESFHYYNSRHCWTKAHLDGIVTNGQEPGRRLIPESADDANLQLTKHLSEQITRAATAEGKLEAFRNANHTMASQNLSLHDELNSCKESNDYLQGELKDANERCIKLKAELDQLLAYKRSVMDIKRDDLIAMRNELDDLRARPVCEWVEWSREAPTDKDTDHEGFVICVSNRNGFTVEDIKETEVTGCYWLRNCPPLPKQETEAEATEAEFWKMQREYGELRDIESVVKSAIAFTLEKKNGSA